LWSESAEIGIVYKFPMQGNCQEVPVEKTNILRHLKKEKEFNEKKLSENFKQDPFTRKNFGTWRVVGRQSWLMRPVSHP
jgi:hypothetical protein